MLAGVGEFVSANPDHHHPWHARSCSRAARSPKQSTQHPADSSELVASSSLTRGGRGKAELYGGVEGGRTLNLGIANAAALRIGQLLLRERNCKSLIPLTSDLRCRTAVATYRHPRAREITLESRKSPAGSSGTFRRFFGCPISADPTHPFRSCGTRPPCISG